MSDAFYLTILSKTVDRQGLPAYGLFKEFMIKSKALQLLNGTTVMALK
jgi:hypothetical protein